MSDTPRHADACMKLLDNGWEIRLFRNQLGSYTAQGRPRLAEAMAGRRLSKIETDDFTPAQTLYRLAEKLLGNMV